MNKSLKFILLSVLLLAGRFYDLYTTSLYTPTLNKELNPIVKYLGAGWPLMITLQILLSLAIIGCLYYYMFLYRPAMPIENGLKRSQVFSCLLYRDPYSFSKLFYKLPVKETLIAATGYVGTAVLICISFIVGTSTTLLLTNDAYRALYKKGIPLLLYGIILILALCFYYRFFNRYYLKYKKIHVAEAKP